MIDPIIQACKEFVLQIANESKKKKLVEKIIIMPFIWVYAIGVLLCVPFIVFFLYFIGPIPLNISRKKENK